MYTFFYLLFFCKTIFLFLAVCPNSEIRVLSSLYLKSVGLCAQIYFRKMLQKAFLTSEDFFIVISIYVCNTLFCYSQLVSVLEYDVDILLMKMSSWFSPITPMPLFSTSSSPRGKVYSILWVHTLL